MPTLTATFLKTLLRRKKFGKQVIRYSIKGMDLFSRHIQRCRLGSDEGKTVAEETPSMYKEDFSLTSVKFTLDVKSNAPQMFFQTQLCPRLDRQENLVVYQADWHCKAYWHNVHWYTRGWQHAICYVANRVYSRCGFRQVSARNREEAATMKKSSVWLQLVQRCYCRVLAFSRFGTCRRLYTIGNTVGEHNS